jgi:hypothetical protein
MKPKSRWVIVDTRDQIVYFEPGGELFRTCELAMHNLIVSMGVGTGYNPVKVAVLAVHKPSPAEVELLAALLDYYNVTREIGGMGMPVQPIVDRVEAARAAVKAKGGKPE